MKYAILSGIYGSQMKRSLLAAGVCCALLAVGGADEPKLAGEGGPLKVGVVISPPFVMRSADGQWEGLAVTLWQGMVRSLNVTCEYSAQDIAGVVQGLRNGSLDVGIGRFVPTAQLNSLIDFSHVYYYSGLGIAVERQNEIHHWREVLRVFSKPAFLKILIVVGAWLVISGMAVWWIEYRRNRKNFGGGCVSGIGSGVWWSASTLTTVGYGDKVPITFAGRLIALVVMLVGILLISAFTATVTSLITASRMQTRIDDVNNLRGLRVGVVTNSLGSYYLQNQKINCKVFPSVTDVLQALVKVKLDAVVHDLPVLQYYTRQQPFRTIDILPNHLLQVGYSLAIPQGSPWRSRLNTALLEQTVKPEWDQALFTYVGE